MNIAVQTQDVRAIDQSVVQIGGAIQILIHLVNSLTGPETRRAIGNNTVEALLASTLYLATLHEGMTQQVSEMMTEDEENDEQEI